MIKYYECWCSVLKDGETIAYNYDSISLQEENEARTITFDIGWNNINLATCCRHSSLKLQNTKRGIKIHYPGGCIKQWKEPNLRLTVKYEYIEKHVPIRQILNYPDANMAIQYLKEHGFSVAAGQ